MAKAATTNQANYFWGPTSELMYSTFRNAVSSACFALLLLPFVACGQGKPVPWTPGELMEPATLAKAIADSSAKQPVIFDIGPVGGIPGSIHIGPGGEAASQDKLRAELAKLPKDAEVVIYCGCCPYSRCPNVRPAFNILKEMGFKNGKLLDLKDNMKQDWIDKGYPVAQ